MKLFSKFSHDLENRNRVQMNRLKELHQNQNQAIAAFSANGLGYIKKAFDETCRSWAKRLDRYYYPGKRGTFLRTCPLYEISEDDWDGVMEMQYDIGREKRQEVIVRAAKIERDASLAALAVSDRIDEVWKTCWHCKATASDSKLCSSCSVARYCSKDCQRSAWHEGHKNTCQTHKQIYDATLEQLDIVDAAHEAGGTMHGIYLNDEIDYRTVMIMAGEVEDGMKGPSMEYFYENLARIDRGEWWIFNNPDSLNDFGDNRSTLAGITKVLCYDLHNYVASRNDGKVDSSAIESLFGPDSEVMKQSRDPGTKMPAEYLINFYGCRRPNNKLSDSSSRQKLKQYVKGVVLIDLRDVNEERLAT